MMEQMMKAKILRAKRPVENPRQVPLLETQNEAWLSLSLMQSKGPCNMNHMKKLPRRYVLKSEILGKLDPNVFLYLLVSLEDYWCNPSCIKDEGSRWNFVKARCGKRQEEFQKLPIIQSERKPKKVLCQERLKTLSKQSLIWHDKTAQIVVKEGLIYAANRSKKRLNWVPNWAQTRLNKCAHPGL